MLYNLKGEPRGMFSLAGIQTVFYASSGPKLISYLKRVYGFELCSSVQLNKNGVDHGITTRTNPKLLILLLQGTTFIPFSFHFQSQEQQQ